jgi:hypothetical protein
VSEALLEQPAVGEAGQPIVGGQVEQLARTLVEQGQLLQQAHHLGAVDGAPCPQRPPARLRPGIVRQGRQRHHRHARRRGLQPHQGAEVGQLRRTHRQEDDAWPLGRELRQRRLQCGHHEQARLGQLRFFQQVLDVVAELTLTADGQHGEIAALRRCRRGADLGPEHGGQMDRHASVRRVSSGISGSAVSRNRRIMWSS